ncbi:MAG: PTS sugar transporter subunit IIC [Elusimicrobiota bacterium]|jgi:PTS system cellobiose-specific IIC component|nr:PTS sugar transporter subunit IIC [Elusimicrobiota bacterium]
MKNFLNNFIFPILLKVINSKVLLAIKDGILYVMPLTIVGAIFLLLTNFPYTPVVDFLKNVHLYEAFRQGAWSTYDIMALVASVTIAHEYVKSEGIKGSLTAGLISLVTFLIIQNQFIVKDGVNLYGVLDKAWLGGKGMIAAILIGIFVGYIYSWFLKRDIRIKLPESVPEGVSNAFNGLIPSLVIFFIATFIYAIFNYAWDMTFIEAIYRVLQVPLQGMTDSLPGVIAVAFITPFLWFFGIHGAGIVAGVMNPIFLTNMTDNAAVIASGADLTLQNGHIVTIQFSELFLTMTGSGITIGIVVFMLFFAKSAQNKEIGKLSAIPMLFNINEPILFGTPVVLNPLLAIPFILMPVISAIITYYSLSWGLVPLFTGITVPWTTPPLISGFIAAGWRGALLQLVIIVISCLFYYPFIRRVDRLNLETEKAGAQAGSK